MTATAEQLKATATACRLKITWFGTTRALSHDQIKQAAESFDADQNMLSARKKLINTRTAAWRSVSKIKTHAVGFWKKWTTPYPEPGLRLIRKQDIEFFDATMQQYQNELHEAVKELEQNYFQIRNQAEEDLGSLFNAEDYPPSLQGQFGFTWEFPSVEPPIDLATIAPAIYENEVKKAQVKLQEAITLAEQAFISEFAQLVQHLQERLTTNGEKKVFRDSAINNMQEFFGRFKKLNINSNADLDKLVQDACVLMEGITPKMLRKSEELKADIAKNLNQVSQQLEGMIIKAPRRKLIMPQDQEVAA